MKTPTDIFSVIGTFQIVEGRRKFIPKSKLYFQDQMRKVPLQKEVVCTFSEKKTTRSLAQLRYHMVLMGYLAEYSGCTREEMHDAVMKLKYGTKQIKIGNKTVDVRRSVANSANFPKGDMTELIQYDLELCAENGVVVPSLEELGYLPSSFSPLTPVLKETIKSK